MMKGKMKARGWQALVLAAALLAVGGARADDTLYHDLGDQDGVKKIVAYAVAGWVADPRIGDQFDNINLDRFRNRLFDQFCELTDGPCKYPGRDMYASHKGLHLDTAQFNALVEDLQTAMDQAGIPFFTQNRFLALLAPMKHQIVTR
jgi:hemoglobin